MKKITLFALAAMSAVGASAVSPVTPVPAVPTKADLTVKKVDKVARLAAASRANEEVTVNPAFPLYVSPNSLYLGSSQNGYGYDYPFSIAPSRGSLLFTPIQGTTENQWFVSVYKEETEEPETETFTQTSNELELPLYLGMQTDGSITMKTTVGGQEYEYNDSVVTILAGLSAYSWGLPTQANLETVGYFGLTPTPAIASAEHKHISSYAIGFDHTKYSSSNGLLSAAWNQIFPTERFSDLKMVSFGSVIPATAAPYQLSNVFFSAMGTTTEATPITASIYEYTTNEQGDILKGKMLGKGTTVLPQGSFSAKETGYVGIEVKAVNSLGLATSRPVCTSGQSVYVEISGLDAASITSFYPIVQGGEYVPCEEGRPNAIWDAVYPKHAYLGFTANHVETNEESSYIIENPWWFPGDGEVPADGYMGSDYCMWYVMEFPAVMNYETGLDEFKAEIPAAGGSDVLGVISNHDIAQLYSDGVINAVASADWIDFEVGYQELEDGGLTTVTVSAEALPAGESGREGTIEFTGYACDFTVNVLQGESGISAVVANGNGASQYFDLQGRRLTSAPAKGFYIERNGTRAATKLAR